MNKIMVVEDEKLIRQGIISMIRRSGIPVAEIWEAANGEAALELIAGQKFDVVFTDIRMPKMDGLALVKELQKLASPPVMIAISGYDEFNYAVEMLRSGVREYILKPIERDILIHLLGRLEEEISQKAATEQGRISIGYQQLKFWMVNDQLTEAETEIIVKQYEEWFFPADYMVCCTNNTKGIMASGEHHIYLSDVGAHELYIIEGGDTLGVWEQLLQGRYVGISSRHCGLGELKTAFQEAVAARREAFWRNKKVILYKPSTLDKNTPDINTPDINIHAKNTSEQDTLEKEIPKKVVVAMENPEKDISEKEIHMTVQQLGTNQEKAARRRISEIFFQGRRGGYQAAVMEKSIQLLLRLFQEMYGTVVEMTSEAEDLFGPLYVYDCVDQLEKSLDQWLDRLSVKLRKDFDDFRNKQKIKQAILYIHENYNTDLNMAVVSNAISMNYSLFSHTFKLYTGSKFVDYIKELRIKEAKKLLETTELKIHEISQKIGYENEKHFMKTFKVACGVSPTEYRKNMLHKSIRQ